MTKLTSKELALALVDKTVSAIDTKTPNADRVIIMQLIPLVQLLEVARALQTAVSIAEDKLDYRPDDEEANEWADIKAALSALKARGILL